MKTTRGDHFFYGAVFVLCFFGLLQDWLGLEGYIEFVRDRWVDLPWWIWAVGMIAAVLRHHIKAVEADSDERDAQSS